MVLGHRLAWWGSSKELDEGNKAKGQLLLQVTSFLLLRLRCGGRCDGGSGYIVVSNFLGKFTRGRLFKYARESVNGDGYKGLSYYGYKGLSYYRVETSRG